MSILRTIALFVYLFGYMIVHYATLRRAERALAAGDMDTVEQIVKANIPRWSRGILRVTGARMTVEGLGVFAEHAFARAGCVDQYHVEVVMQFSEVCCCVTGYDRVVVSPFYDVFGQDMSVWSAADGDFDLWAKAVSYFRGRLNAEVAA